jgi:mRNA interferase RelE/StbE
LAWTIEYTESARRQLRKLDRQIARSILDFMDERISGEHNPRDTGKALTGNLLGAFWRYRIGDFRIICNIHDEKLCVLVVQIGNRREVYR